MAQAAAVVKWGCTECVDIVNDRKIHIFLSEYIMKYGYENKKIATTTVVAIGFMMRVTTP
jgi:hypothetical protein